MNIHEHQAKQILKKFGIEVPNGVFAFSVEDLINKVKKLDTDKYVLKAQIHAGGRGKAGGVKILNNIDELAKASKELLGKKLVTPQTGSEGKEVKRLYVEESSSIEKEFYLSCLVDSCFSFHKHHSIEKQTLIQVLVLYPKRLFHFQKDQLVV